MLRKETVKKIITITVVLYPIFFRYMSFIPSITVSEIFLMIIILIAGSMHKYRLEIDKGLLFFWAHMFIYALCMLLGTNRFDELGTEFRLVFLYFAIVFIHPYFEYSKGIKYLNNVSVFIAVYGLIQIAAYHFGMVLPTELPFFTAYRDAHSEMLALKEFGFNLRIRSLFGEPAELCHYLILPLTISLFGKEKVPHGLLLSILYSFVCIASMSSTGIIMVIFLWGVYLLDFKKRKTKGFVFIVALVIIGAFLTVFLGIWDYFVLRTFSGGVEKSTRFYAIQEMFAGSSSLSGFLFGIGMSEPEKFLPGFARLFLWQGIVGVLLYMYYMIKIARECHSEKKVIWIVFLVLNMGAALLLGDFALLYLSFLTANDEEGDKREKIDEKNVQNIYADH